MAKVRVAVPEDTKLEVIARCSNRCCVCQTPFVVIHHLDEDPSNNDIGNLAPLCPNCHSQAHSQTKLTMQLSAARIVLLRDRWYEYSERRREHSSVGPNAVLKLKNFVRSSGLAQHGWAKTFSAVDPAYGELTVDEIINRVFNTTNRDDLTTYLETVKSMYQVEREESMRKRFEAVCNAFGIGYDELP